MGKNNENENVHVERLDNTQVRRPILQERFLRASPTKQILSKMEVFGVQQPTISSYGDTKETRYRQYEQSDEWATDLLRRYFPEEYERIQSQKSAYLRFNESDLGKTLDWVDLGLDAASVIPGPVGAFAGAAGSVTGIPLGVLAIDDMIDNGVNVHNFTDAMKILPMGSVISRVSNKGLNLMGKTNKYARRVHPYFRRKSATRFFPSAPSGIDMVKMDKAYFPYFAPIWVTDAANIGTDIMHLGSE